MARRLTLLAAALLLSACSKITEENFAKIEDAMAEREVISLLGSPTESDSFTMLGVSGTTARWVGRDAVITVQFVNGKAVLKSFNKPAND